MHFYVTLQVLLKKKKTETSKIILYSVFNKYSGNNIHANIIRKIKKKKWCYNKQFLFEILLKKFVFYSLHNKS